MLQSMTSGDKAFVIFAVCTAAVIIVWLIADTVKDIAVAKYENKGRDGNE